MTMEKTNTYEFDKTRDTVFKFAVLQITAVTLILVILFIVRLVSGTTFSQFCEMYKNYFTDETDIEIPEIAETVSDEPLKIENMTYNRSDLGNINALCVPVNGVLTSGFGKRPDPFTDAESHHYGIDIAAPYGTEIGVCADGIIEKTGCESGYGNFVIVKHSDNFKSLYGHCSRICVSEGEKIKAGETVALVGSTGRSTGNHLHFEIRINGQKVNPLWYLTLEGEK